MLYYADTSGEDVLGRVQLRRGSITAQSPQNILYLQYMWANTLNYIMHTSAAPNTFGDAGLASTRYSFQQSWFIKLLVGDRDPLIGAKRTRVLSVKGKQSAERSTSLQLPNQSWQRSASIDMRCIKKTVCVCVFQSGHCV